jgi:hypothetical protein
MLRSKQQVSSEPLLSSIIPFAGSGLLGYAMGFALKKVLKWMLIIIGFLAGGVQHVMKSQGYQGPYSPDFDVYVYLDIANSNFSKYRLKYCRS